MDNLQMDEMLARLRQHKRTIAELKQAAEAIEAYPLVKTLIVSGDALPEARIKVKTPGNALYANYMKLKLAGKEGK